MHVATSARSLAGACLSSLGRIGAVLLALACAAGAAHGDNRVALVIGNNHYAQLDPDHQLQKAINDAEAVGDALERDGFKVLRGTDLTRSQMVDKLYELSAMLQPGDTAVFYFAGHGVALAGGNYLLPTDVPEVAAGQEMRIASQSMAETDVIDSLRDKGARVTVVILDACRDNPFKKPGTRSVGLERGFGRIPETSGVFSLYSAGYGQSALDRLSDDDHNPNSVFTRVLVPLLTRPGLNLDDLAYDVREQVSQLAATTADHHEQVPAAYDQITGGRVYLAALPPPPVAAPAPAPEALTAPPAPPLAAPVAPTPQIAPTPPAPVAATLPSAPRATTAALEPPRSAGPTTSSAEGRILAYALQAELDRLGCDAGPPNGDWSVQSRMALLQFGERRKLTLNVDQPDPSTLDLLRQQHDPVCPSRTQAQPGPEQTPATHKPPRKVAQQAEPRRAVLRPAVRRPAEPRASSCFMFNGQRVCE